MTNTGHNAPVNVLAALIIVVVVLLTPNPGRLS